MADTLPLNQVGEEKIPEPNFLPGEIMVACARKVLRFSAMTESKSGISGILYVTNFRVSFLTMYSSSETPLSSVFQSNPDLSQGGINAEIQQELHIPQTCIHDLYYQSSKSGTKFKKLVPNKKVTSKIQLIQIHCKDFRVIEFGLKFTPKEEQTLIANALMHYAYPSSMSLLFAVNYSKLCLSKKESDENRLGNTILAFRTLQDWLSELSRLNVDDTWRVANVNENFKTCPNQSQIFVCLASLTDSDINRMSLHYVESRFPVWCWSHPLTGVPIMYSASGRPESIFLEKEETSLFRALSTLPCNPEHKEVKVIDVAKTCPTIQSLALSFVKVRELCVLETTKSFWTIDANWLSSLDATRWLSYIRESIVSAIEVAKAVCDDGRPVIVKEINGRDIVLVVSSLAQLILDSYYRTIRGFQTLLQKMWVLGGHPFNKRCGHIKRQIKPENEKEDNQESPVFLHFLDCVYQLMNQFPSEFEFSETYLLGLFDSMHACMFDTFLFDCEEQRCSLSKAELDGNPMESLWDFLADQLANPKITSAFVNPLFEFRGCKNLLDSNGETDTRELYERVNGTAPAMKFWSGCYLRWLPTVHVSIGMGENSASHLQQMILMNEVRVLRHRMTLLSTEKDNSEKGLNEDQTLTDAADNRWDSDMNFTLDLESSKLLTPSLPFIGDLALSKYCSGDMPQADLEKSADIGTF